jgi:hypothetical protein
MRRPSIDAIRMRKQPTHRRLVNPCILISTRRMMDYEGVEFVIYCSATSKFSVHQHD